MGNMADIKASMRAIGDTNKITKAMKLISTSKRQKALARYNANQLYFDRVRIAIKDVLIRSKGRKHPFLLKHNEGVPVYIVIAGDKGLCGGYNHDILNFAVKFMSKGEKYIYAVGQETRPFFERRNIPINTRFLHVLQNPSIHTARSLIFSLSELYMQKEINEAYLIYTRYYSPVKQKPTAMRLFPLNLVDFEDVQLEEEDVGEIQYHPSTNDVFSVLVPQYIAGLFYGALIQAYASENSARMMAMESATKNAEEMLAKLNIGLNRARQQLITREITEIVGAMDALNT